ncbi:hypothetical protein EYF80_050334 [Liparis tanakae]|uniref:Uncharacterized protein n=1 Tax=Liparis tanakae TaxID=230148 RepID=A0A4Z2FF49_9TELE|nr:hypothetical protein EYF80_050334 [Liparis tanakae]
MEMNSTPTLLPPGCVLFLQLREIHEKLKRWMLMMKSVPIEESVSSSVLFPEDEDPSSPERLHRRRSNSSLRRHGWRQRTGFTHWSYAIYII